MYREEGREPESEIPHLILERNLYGIDIDARAVQIAALALYLKACSIAGPDFRPGQINLVRRMRCSRARNILPSTWRASRAIRMR